MASDNNPVPVADNDSGRIGGFYIEKGPRVKIVPFSEREYRVKSEVKLQYIVTITALAMGVMMVGGSVFLAFFSSDHLIQSVFAACGTILISTQYASTRTYKRSASPDAGSKKKRSSVSAYFNELNVKN